VLSGFQTLAKSAAAARKNLAELDKLVEKHTKASGENPVLIGVDEAVKLLELAYANLEFDDSTDDDRQAHVVAIQHLSRISPRSDLKGKVWLLAATDRNVARYREEGRFSNAPDTKQQKDSARTFAQEIPVLMLLRQNGEEAKGWRGLPFWWPVILTPRSAATVIFATAETLGPTSRKRDERSLATEEIA
jgi:hypothetical protein